VLYRSDNSTTVSVINKKGTTAPDLLPVITEILRLCALYDVDLAAVHIPGKINDLADKLSRFVREHDDGDWMFSPEKFAEIHARLKETFLEHGELTLDGSADPNGNNALLPRFCSKVDSILERDIRGENLWINPDFKLFNEVLRHILRSRAASPANTSATVLCPAWVFHDWWPMLKNAKVLAYYPRGTQLFTSPDWQNMLMPDGTYGFGKSRAVRGATRWDVVVIHFPCALSNRCAGGGANRSDYDARRRVGDDVMPTLSGDAMRDVALLRRLRSGVL
jgi:hypothetical protein